MKISFTIQDDKAERDLSAFCQVYNYAGNEKQLFVENFFKDWFKKVSKEQRLKIATDQISVED